jgi:hypothetical protein
MSVSSPDPSTALASSLPPNHIQLAPGAVAKIRTYMQSGLNSAWTAATSRAEPTA